MICLVWFDLVVFAKKGVAIHSVTKIIVVPKWVKIEPLNMTSLTISQVKE